MGAYATIAGREVKYSGLLAQAGANTGIRFDMGMVAMDTEQVTLVAFELAKLIDQSKLIVDYAINYQDVLAIRMASDKLLSLLEWLDTAMSDEQLVFA